MFISLVAILRGLLKIFKLIIPSLLFCAAEMGKMPQNKKFASFQTIRPNAYTRSLFVEVHARVQVGLFVVDAVAVDVFWGAGQANVSAIYLISTSSLLKINGKQYTLVVNLDSVRRRGTDIKKKKFLF